LHPENGQHPEWQDESGEGSESDRLDLLGHEASPCCNHVRTP
jgi:hypothetical protein